MPDRKMDGPSNKNRSLSIDSELTPQNTGAEYPDLNTPLNVLKAAEEPGADVLDIIDTWNKGEEPNDPNNFVQHLEMGKKSGKRR